MNRSYFKRNLISLIAIVALLFGVLSYSNAQEATSTLSGRVVGVDGNPIAGISIAIQPSEVFDGMGPQGHFFVPASQTDDAGHFSIANITPVPVELVVLPYDEPDHEILSVKIGMVTVYQQARPPFGGIAFAIKPGAQVENVEVIAKPRMRIRGQVVFANGTPLTKASIELNISHSSPDGRGGGSSSGGSQTGRYGLLCGICGYAWTLHGNGDIRGTLGNGGAISPFKRTKEKTICSSPSRMNQSPPTHRRGG